MEQTKDNHQSFHNITITTKGNCWFLLHAVFHDPVGRSSENTQPKETTWKPWHIIREGRKELEGVGLVPGTQSSALGRREMSEVFQELVCDGWNWIRNVRRGYRVITLSTMKQDEWPKTLEAESYTDKSYSQTCTLRLVMIFCSTSVLCLPWLSPTSQPRTSFTFWWCFGNLWLSAARSIECCIQCIDLWGPRRAVRQGRAVTVYAVHLQMLVRILMLLEGLRGQTSVIPLLARRRDGCLVHHWLHLAYAIQRAVLLDASVTWPPTRVIFANSPPNLEDRAVVLTDHSCHIGHHKLQLQRVGVEDFKSFELLEKCLLIRVQNLSPTDVGWKILAVRRVEPGNGFCEMTEFLEDQKGSNEKRKRCHGECYGKGKA